MDLFSNFLKISVRVNKYQGVVLKILVYQVYLWNLAKTAPDYYYYFFGVSLGAITPPLEI